MACPAAEDLLEDYRKAILQYGEAVELLRSEWAEIPWRDLRSAHDTCEATMNLLRDHFKKHGCLRRSA
jgi:hypothetical protein